MLPACFPLRAAAVLILLLVLGSAAPARAQAIPLFNTGVDASGTVLAGGAADPHYSVVAGAPAAPAVVITSPPGAWVANSSTSKWVWVEAAASTLGTVTIRTTFDLTGFVHGTTVISGKWATDNSASIVLNGVATGHTLGSSQFGALTSFSISSGFVPGLNTLDFVVTNEGGPGGLRVDAISATALPEPPVISAVQVTSVTQTTATVIWTTDVSASSEVEYRTLGAGAYTTATGAAGTSHTVSLSSLTAGRTYEFRVRSITNGGSAPSSETVFPASGHLQFLTAPGLAGEVLGVSLRRVAGTLHATVTYSNASGAAQTGVQLDFGILSGTSTVNTTSSLPVSLGTVNAGSSASTTLEFSGAAGVAGSSAILTVGYSSSGGGSSSSYRVTLP